MGAHALRRVDGRLDRRGAPVFYPDFYGGSFASCPDAVDFRYHQIVDIYGDKNAYFVDKGWMKVDRPEPDSVLTATSNR